MSYTPGVITADSISTLTNKKLVDSSTTIIDNSDNTKQLAFQCSGISTATTRTLTVQDSSGTVALTSNKLTDFALTPVTASAAGNYTALTTDYIIGKTGITGGGDTISLPAAATAGSGKVYIIKDQSGSAQTNNITIDPDAAETIDGQATIAITAAYGVARIYSNGTAWFTF